MTTKIKRARNEILEAIEDEEAIQKPDEPDPSEDEESELITREDGSVVWCDFDDWGDDLYD